LRPDQGYYIDAPEGVRPVPTPSPRRRGADRLTDALCRVGVGELSGGVGLIVDRVIVDSPDRVCANIGGS